MYGTLDGARLRPGDDQRAIRASRRACCLTTRTGVRSASPRCRAATACRSRRCSSRTRTPPWRRSACRGPISFLRVETPPAGEPALDPGVSRMLIHLLEAVVAPDGGGKHAAIPGLHRRRQDRHGVEGHRGRLRHRPLSRRVRRHRAGEQPAPRGRRDHRRTGRRQVLRRRRGGAGVLRRRGRRVAPARGAARCAGAATPTSPRARWPRDERRRRRSAEPRADCWTASPSCRATSRSPISRRTAAPRGPAARSSRCTAASSTASSTRRRRSPMARARCCGSPRRSRWCPICLRRSWSRRCRACASTRARSPIASSARRRRAWRSPASPAPTARPPAPIYSRRRSRHCGRAGRLHGHHRHGPAAAA